MQGKPRSGSASTLPEASSTKPSSNSRELPSPQANEHSLFRDEQSRDIRENRPEPRLLSEARSPTEPRKEGFAWLSAYDVASGARVPTARLDEEHTALQEALGAFGCALRTANDARPALLIAAFRRNLTEHFAFEERCFLLDLWRLAPRTVEDLAREHAELCARANELERLVERGRRGQALAELRTLAAMLSVHEERERCLVGLP